jgi:hypothetical protein
MLQGHPTSTKLPEDLGFGERFWYWRGVSGQSYIHSIYSLDSCPPLPGAVYVAVSRRDGERRPVSVGRFPSAIEGRGFDPSACIELAHLVDEIHVHLLARDARSAEAVRSDLEHAMEMEAEDYVEAFRPSRPAQLELMAV